MSIEKYNIFFKKKYFLPGKKSGSQQNVVKIKIFGYIFIVIWKLPIRKGDIADHAGESRYKAGVRLLNWK